MAKKEFIGITYENDRLRLARLRVAKNSLELLEVDTIHLPQPVLSIREPGTEAIDFPDDYGEIFDTDTSKPVTGLGDFDDEDAAAGDDDHLLADDLDNFDMTQANEDADVASDNERMLAEYVGKYEKSKLNIGLHIPFGKTTFQFLKNVDPGKMSKKDRKEFFEEKLKPIFGREISDEQYSWAKIGENNCLLAYNPDDHELINLVELAETYTQKKLLILDRVPDEAIWAGLIRANYDLHEEDITGLIAIGDSSSRIMFMKGREIVNVLPIITEGENSEDILNTIFSKILFEIDKGDIPKINRLLFVRTAKLSEKAITYFQKHFEDVEVDYFTPNPDKLGFADEILNSPVYLQPYITAIGAAWAASGVNEDEFAGFSLLPEYVREKQRVMKLEWHGIAILVLIALTPLFLNNLYMEKADELRFLEQEVSSLEIQIEDLRPLANMTQDLISDHQVIEGENERLLTLAQYSQKWSEVMRILNEGVAEIPNMWLTTLRTSDGNNINLSGISLTREQIPVLATLFTDANINQVSEIEIRGQQVYSFALQSNNFRQDIEEFLLDMPEFDFDSEFNGSEIELDFSYDPEILNQAQQTVAVLNEPPQSVSPVMNEEVSNPAPVQQTSSVNEETVHAENHSVAEDVEVNESTNSGSITNSREQAPAVSQSQSNSSPYGLKGPEDELLYGSYTIVLHSIPLGNRADAEKKVLTEEGYKATLWQAKLDNGDLTWRIGVGQFETADDALAAATELPEPYRSNNFIIRIR